MAELKFRAWHKKAKKFFECVGFADLMGDKVVYIVSQSAKKRLVLGDRASDYEINQSTGLFDSFGQEIYEGDVVLIFEDSKIARRVFWWPKRATWGLASSKREMSLYVYGRPIYKVIGNIYQNPEYNENTETA